MPALSFQKQFGPDIRSGKKRQTVRRKWKRPIKVGDSLFLFTGMRTKRCFRLMSTACTQIQIIRVGQFSDITIDGETLDEKAAHKFAKADGFLCWEDLVDWLDHYYDLPFEGVVIHWRYVKA